MSTTVVAMNGHNGDPGWADVVYVGRPQYQGGWRLAGHPLANPFKVGRDADNFEDAVTRYREYLLGRPDLLALLPDLRGKRIGCWDHKGAPCHADVIAELADANDMADA